MLRFIVSPAKTMRPADELAELTTPVQAEKTARILDALSKLSRPELQALWGTSDKLTDRSCDELEALLAQSARPSQALFTYDGIQYTSMAPGAMTQPELDYVYGRLRIVSGLYGMVRPTDGVAPYRLEMQARLSVDGSKNLYDFWGASIAEAIEADAAEKDLVVVNLASKEYARAVVPHLSPSTTCVTCDFGSLDAAGRLKMRATQAKAARGAFVAWCARTAAEKPTDFVNFDLARYRHVSELSTPAHLVFAQDPA
jgi:hypothetical protein